MNNDEIIRQAIENTKRFDMNHYKTLLGQRKAGSQWATDCICNSGEQLFQFWKGAELIQEEDEGKTLIFRMTSSDESYGRVGMMTRNQALKYSPTCVVRRGEHGLEFFMNINSKDVNMKLYEPTETNVRHLILGHATKEGETESTQVVFTAYPGPLTDPVPAELLEENEGEEFLIEELEGNWAIKFEIV